MQSDYARLAGISPAALTAAMEPYLPIIHVRFLLGPAASPALRELLQQVEAGPCARNSEAGRLVHATICFTPRAGGGLIGITGPAALARSGVAPARATIMITSAMHPRTLGRSGWRRRSAQPANCLRNEPAFRSRPCGRARHRWR